MWRHTRTSQILIPLLGQCSIGFLAVSILTVMLTIGGPSSQCRSETTAKKTGTTYKLNASVFQFAGPAGKDVVYRYCTDEGVQAYAQKDFSKAEDLFSAAVADAQKRKIQGPLLAMMLANLASAQREGKKLLQSRNTFRLAVAALSSSPPNLRSSINFTRALNYIAPQYAALLNKLHLESEAKFIEESPLTLLAAREDRDVLAGSVEKTEPTVPARTRIPARAEKREPVEEGAERTDLGSRSPFEDEKHAEPTIRNGGGGVTPSNVEQPAERVQERESITIRQTAFYWEPRNMYDALKAAVYYLGRGIDVTVMLDRMAVQVANRHDMKEVVEGDKLVPVKDILLEFLQKGGTVLVSQTWAGKLGYITGGNLPAGVKLLSDDEMRDEIFKRRRTLIDY